jgi:hypothetical protein
MVRYDKNGILKATRELDNVNYREEMKKAKQFILIELGYDEVVMNLMKTKRKKQVLYAIVEMEEKNIPATPVSISRYIQSHYDEKYNHNPLRMRNYLYRENWNLEELNLVKNEGFTKRNGTLFKSTSLGKRVYEKLKSEE